MSTSGSSARAARIAQLRRERPRSRFLRVSVVLLAALGLWACASGEVAWGELFSARRAENLARFLEQDATPWPLRESGWSLAGLATWAGKLIAERGLEALGRTFWISVLAIVLAGVVASLAAPLGARTLMTRDPFGVRDDTGPVGLGWRLGCEIVRTSFVVARAVPEYLLAFLLLAIFGPTPWPAVCALAVHNAGILGRLGSDTIENLDRAPLRALRMAGVSRAQLAGVALPSLGLTRFLLYYFYRFETCVREATVLGMLGVVSLGYWIQDARARQHYDELLLFVALGAALVAAADLTSIMARAWIRRGT